MNVSEHSIEVTAAVLFSVALVHTFAAKQFERLSHRFPRHAGLFHLLGEVEVVFGFWAMVLLLAMAVGLGREAALGYAESRHFTEPLFVFVIMVMTASRPIFQAVMAATSAVAGCLPVRPALAKAWLGLAAVPLLGSFITEPAAMTIAALMLGPQIFRPDVPERSKYFALGVLFVNVSIGGTFTSFAAPPVLMVASAWSWDSAHMATTFGWRSAVAVLINATLATFVLRSHLQKTIAPQSEMAPVPLAATAAHFAFLIAAICMAHHPVVFLGIFLMFLGFMQAYQSYQSPPIIKEALLVAFFLAGLVVLGGMQQWWLQPIVSSLTPRALFYGATVLTAVTDNAALTYLGSLISGISEQAKYNLVAGAVTGGGLTVIANAPNPAGVALVRRGFAEESVGAGGLFLGAAFPTLVVVAAFQWL